MGILEIISFSILQGTTEFLPISSSGQLQILKSLLGNQEELKPAYDVLLHFGTILSLLFFFRKNLIKGFKNGSEEISQNLKSKPSIVLKLPYIRYFTFIIVANIPIAIIGLLYKQAIYSLFGNLYLISFNFVITSCFLYLIHFKKKGNIKITNFSYLFPIAVGLFQLLSTLPGISRSASCLFIAIMFGANEKESTSFIFLISIPVILGASLLEIIDAVKFLTNPIYLIGIFISFLSGFLFLKLFYYFLQKNLFYLFAIYTQLLSILTLYLALKQ